MAWGCPQQKCYLNYRANAQDCLDDAGSTEPDYWQKEIRRLISTQLKLIFVFPSFATRCFAMERSPNWYGTALEARRAERPVRVRVPLSPPV